jgi:hypothetical protein
MDAHHASYRLVMDSQHITDPAEARHNALARLGYPGFAHRRSDEPAPAPVQLLTEILSSGDVDARTLEALPWLLVRFTDVDWKVLVAAAVAQGWQNRLGYMTSCAAKLAADMRLPERAADLHNKAVSLLPFLKDQEDTLCHESMTQAERRWLADHTPPEARQWNLLTDLVPEYAHVS